jgi:hypothetical protein
VQPANLAEEARGVRTIMVINLGPYGLVMCQGVCAPTSERKEIRKPLAYQLYLSIATAAVA